MDDLIDDLFILRLIRAGDRLAFKHLFELYFAPLCRFVHLYIKKPEAAEDIVLDIDVYKRQGWRLSEESFFEKAKDVVNNLKIRASFGSLGNQAVNSSKPNYYPYIETMNTSLSSWLIDGQKTQNVSSPNPCLLYTSAIDHPINFFYYGFVNKLSPLLKKPVGELHIDMNGYWLKSYTCLLYTSC